MIRYELSRDALEAEIARVSRSWLKRVRVRTETFAAGDRYDERKSIWHEIKEVFIAVQHGKCAYCETKLAPPPHGLGVHHVEHFRPKGEVMPWPTPEVRRERAIRYRLPPHQPWASGYHQLAYQPRNYATVCYPCNTYFKANWFPIAGARGPQSREPADLAGERPFLVYPLGDLDDDPEEILGFNGLMAIPRVRSGHRHKRARVIIDFFNLNGRDELRRDRAAVIVNLWDALCDGAGPPGEVRDEGARRVGVLCSERWPHTNCARCFRDLFRSEPGRSQDFYDEAYGLLYGPPR